MGLVFLSVYGEVPLVYGLSQQASFGCYFVLIGKAAATLNVRHLSIPGKLKENKMNP